MGVVMEPFGSAHRPMGTNQVKRWMIKTFFLYRAHVILSREDVNNLSLILISGQPEEPQPGFTLRSSEKGRFAIKAPRS
jgi:hypothetical protein